MSEKWKKEGSSLRRQSDERRGVFVFKMRFLNPLKHQKKWWRGRKMWIIKRRGSQKWKVPEKAGGEEMGLAPWFHQEGWLPGGLFSLRVGGDATCWWAGWGGGWCWEIGSLEGHREGWSKSQNRKEWASRETQDFPAWGKNQRETEWGQVGGVGGRQGWCGWSA